MTGMTNSVENTMPIDNAQTDAAQDQGESLESIAAEVPSEQPEAAPAAEDQAPAKEPGWIKNRIDKAVSKAEQRIRAEYEAKLAPLYESIYDRQAEELVAAGEFKTLSMAKEYVRMKNGIPAQQPSQEAPAQETPVKDAAPRDAQGRFAPRQDAPDPVFQARADLLVRQADKIRNNRGIDVMSVFNSDPDVKTKVLSGEWDFYDVADAVRESRTAPVPIRSANGGAPGGFDIARMTDAQFKKLQENLASGHRYDLTK